MSPPQIERLEMNQERYPSVRSDSMSAPLIHSFLSSPIPSQSSLLPSTISVHISLTSFSTAFDGKRYAKKS
jgi:hypothetical protein